MKLTAEQYNALNKIARLTNMDCWFSLRQSIVGHDYVYDLEERKKMSVRRAVALLEEGIPDYEYLMTLGLTDGEVAAFEELLAVTHAASLVFQIKTHFNETSCGEPQAFADLPNGCSLEVTHEEYGLSKKEQFYSWRVHCSEGDFEGDKYHGTCGVIDQTTSKDIKNTTCIKLINWACRVARHAN